MHILHPWYYEREEEEAKLGQFVRGNPWGKLYYLRRLFVRVDVAARLPKLFRTPLPPPKGAAGSMRGWLKGKLLSHDHVRILGQPPKTQLAQSIQSRRGNNASCFLHFIYFQTLQWFCRTGLFLPQRPPWQTVNCYLKEVQPTLPKVNFGRKFFSSCPVFINIEAFHSLHIRFRNKCRRVLDGFFFLDLEGYGSFAQYFNTIRQSRNSAILFS